MNDLYDTDVLAWAERQADLLRRRDVHRIDWDHVAEEIEDVGRSALRSAAPHLVMAVLYDLMVIAWPEAREVPRWRAENRMRHDEARAACAPSMVGRRELDVDELYRRALRGMPETIDGVPPLPVPVDPWFTLAGLLADRA